MEVHMTHATQMSMNGSTDYATVDDFRRIFSEKMNDLYLLALLLTADAEKAEQCFVAGIGDSVEGNPVFKEWAYSWARRTIILQAIRMIEPAHGKEIIAGREEVSLDIDPRLQAVLILEPLERFVFVMSVLEGYSYQDCSLLLRCSQQTAANARARALEHLANPAEIIATYGHKLKGAYTPVAQ
jgi:DNA-directed RNA polymerase specialized sigma24 family protein